MAKWEYLTEKYALSFFQNPKKQKEAFDEFGSKGWELVSVIPLAQVAAFTTVPITKEVIAYFKREKK